jgi:hypothetical protein
MAKYDGIITLKGKAGGMVFYTLNGKNIIRSITSVDRNRIMNDPSFARSRECMKEFGGASKAAKAFRMCFAALGKTLRDPTLNGRVTSMMYKIGMLGGGERGKRAFEFGLHKDMLKGFEFNRNRSLASLFWAGYNPIVFNTNRDKVTWNVPVFNTDRMIAAPSGSTHFRLFLAAGILSRYVYNCDSGEYEPSQAALNHLNGLMMSPPMALGGNTPTPVTLGIDLGIGSALSSDVVVPAAIGILFYQEIDGALYELKGCWGMRTEAAE